MDLRQAITEQWQERFPEEERYLKQVEECETTPQLIYHMMNIDMEGHAIIAEKLKMSHRDLAFFLSSYRALDQGSFYEGENGFAYKKEEFTKDGENYVKYTYPDGTASLWRKGD